MKSAFTLALALIALVGSTGGQAAADPAVLHLSEPFRCEKYKQPINFGAVIVSVSPASASAVAPAANLGNFGECTGRIGYLAVSNFRHDGVKVGVGAHDLVVASGSIECPQREGKVHQDGIQVQGGRNVTFTNFEIACFGGHSNAMFINSTKSGSKGIQNVVCDRCTVKDAVGNPDVLFVVHIMESRRSGIRNSLICDPSPSSWPVRVGKKAIQPVNEGNVVAPC